MIEFDKVLINIDIILFDIISYCLFSLLLCLFYSPIYRLPSKTNYYPIIPYNTYSNYYYLGITSSPFIYLMVRKHNPII